MMPHATILTDRQQIVLHSLAEDSALQSAFVLSGGTALAEFYLHHRLSDDLDFFSLAPVDVHRVDTFIAKLKERIQASQVTMQRLYDRHLFVLAFADGSELKLEFTHHQFPRLAEPMLVHGIFVESLRDAAANKLAAMLDRYEPKDYYDLYALLHGHCTLDDLRPDVERKTGMRIEPIFLGEVFARAARLPLLPHLLMPVSLKELVAFFQDIAKSLREEVLE